MFASHSFGPSPARKITSPLLACLLAVLLLPGCATMKKLSASLGFSGETEPAAVETLVENGMNDYNHGEYTAALKSFTEIKERFPFTSPSLLAELKAADCQYYLGHTPEAVALYKDFENNHPTNEAIPYIMFQIGMSYYNQIDTIDRDPGAAANAIAAFSRLLKSFPSTPYTNETQARIKAATNFLANNEFYVAHYYLRTESYPQAEARIKYLLDHYPESTVAPKAKELLAAIQSGNPPKRTWRDWIPELSLPDWQSFSSLGFAKKGSDATN